MKYLDEYRDPTLARQLVEQVRRHATRQHTLMEVCGGQTHAIVRYGIDELLAGTVHLIHGPGCPVCVTPLEIIDKALAIASQPGVIFTSFGDMLRVPGSTTDLLSLKARGADVRIVYSPLDALKLARMNPGREVVFLGVGFETTAPATAMALFQAAAKDLQNFSMLISHVLVPPAMEALLSSPNCRVQAFLAAGHVCAVMGTSEYPPIAAKYHVPIVITGFEPLDILHGILMCVEQLESGRAEVENQYSRAVRTQGNPQAQQLIQEVFQVIPRKWRGMGSIPASGLGLNPAYARFDAEQKFAVTDILADEPAECLAGPVLQGMLRPQDCPAFGGPCTPDHPLGAPMVSSEGACAAYHRYRSLTPPSTS